MVQQSAAVAGIAPQVFHVDENRRAVLSALIVDRSLPAHLGNPATRAAAIQALGHMLRSRRDVPVPPGMEPVDAVRALRGMWDTVPSDHALPAFVRDAVDAVRAEPSPSDARPLLMSHNDVNPTNLAFDGERVMLLDWQTAAPNHPLYDLAAIAMFLRFDDATCRQVIAAHDDASVDALPESFLHCRRVAAVRSGVAALKAATSRGHAGGDVPRDATPTLGELYLQMRSGAFDLGSVGGQWAFGLALVKEGAR
jgi:aminoglycoside phosphotransferase (APT) family kinase protein